MTADASVPDGTADVIQHFLENEHGYLSWLDMHLESFEMGRIELGVPFDEKLTNPTEPPTMHGGIAATLIDTAGGLVLRPYLEDPIQGSMATINLNVNYLRPAGSDLIATADVVRAGSTVGVADVVVESETPDDGVQPVATGQAAYRLFQG